MITARDLHTFVAVIALVSSSVAPAQTPAFLRGVDISFIEQYEHAGYSFKDGGNDKELIDLLADRGVNSVRLRLWHTPPDGNNTTAETLQTAQRIKARGMHFLLDFHYSDTWADPAQQAKPVAWQSLSLPDLTTSVRTYTRDVIRALNDQGTLPDMVQLGNEITPGMLWNDGKVGGSSDTTAQWNKLGSLLTAAKAGVLDGLNPGQSVQIMIHIDRGGDNAACRWYYDRLRQTGFEFDVIGLSYYPFWHGTLTDVQQNLLDLESRYHKPLVIVETAYPWTLGWNDNTGNFVGQSNQLLAGYPATVDGQRRYVEDLMGIVRDVPNGRGLGVYYWAPEYVAIPAVPSPYENLTLFDFQGNALESLDAFAPDPPQEGSWFIVQ